MNLYRMPHDEVFSHTVVLANGSFPSEGEALAVLRRAERVVCCDGAVERFVAFGGEPWAVVGDCDSVGESFVNAYCDRIHRMQDQQTSDLNKALAFCLSQGIDSVAIVGATGLRDDHTLANIGIMAEYCDRLSVAMVTDYGVFNAIAGDASFESFAGQQVSLFTLADATVIWAEGLLYPPPANHLRGLWQGLSNESCGERFTVHTDNTALVFRTFTRK